MGPNLPRPRRARGVLLLAFGLLALLGPGSPAADEATDPVLHFPDERRPAVLASMRLPRDLLALAVSADGRRVAVALPAESERRRSTSTIRVHDDGGGVVHVPIEGVVRDLLFVGAEPTLYAVQHLPAKRREGDCHLLRVDLANRKGRREMRLPPSARGLEYWPAGHALLVPSRNELRTIILPMLRSGPLFRIPGENLSVAVLDGTRVLLGQRAALLFVDLADPQTREALPARERISAPSPVVSLAIDAEGRRGLAGLADGRVADIDLAPLALRPRGSGIVVQRGPSTVLDPEPEPSPAETASPTESLPRPAVPGPDGRARDVRTPAEEPDPAPPAESIAAPVTTDSAPAVPVVSPPAEPAPTPAPSEPTAEVEVAPPIAEPLPVAVPAPREPAAELEVAPPTVEPTRTPAPVPARSEPAAGDEVVRPTAEPTPEPAPGPAPESPPADKPPVGRIAESAARDGVGTEAVSQVRGTLDGPAAAAVVAVVLLGPDNLLREAVRVPPAVDGTYAVRGLAPGRYRVQLDAGGGRVLVSRPPYHLVVVTDGDEGATADFRVVGAF